MITQRDLIRFVILAQGREINAYTKEGAERKDRFARLGKKVAQSIAEILKLQNYSVRYNPGGIAVCGEVTLHDERLYVHLSQSYLGPDWGFYYRSCKGLEDYTGGPNQWMTWGDLRDLEKAAWKMARTTGLTTAA